MRIARFDDQRMGVVANDDTMVDITDLLQQYDPLGPEDLSGVYPTLAVAGDILTLGYIGEHDVLVDTISLAGDAAGA